jgi:hypothetical protein
MGASLRVPDGVGTAACYGWAMRTRRLPLLALCAVVAAGAPSSAAAAGMAGFPAYPHASPVSPYGASLPGYVLQSHDSVTTIDRWYRSKLPATCARVALASGPHTDIEYRCRAMRIFLDITSDSGRTILHAYPL